LNAVFVLFRAFTVDQAALAAENLALRQQLVVLHQSAKRPRLRQSDRVFWIWLSRLWKEWRSALIIVRPETVVRWHRQGLRLYWRWKSRTSKVGRPRIDAEVRELIRRMSRENPTWDAPRIQSELYLLGHTVSKSTVEKYMVRSRKPPSQTWRTFLDNHVRDRVSIDFFTIPTATFRVLYCFVVLSHERRRIVHFNVTAYPTAQWTAQQIVEAFPFEETPPYLIRDRDGIYGNAFRERIQGIGINEVVTAPRSPWQNPYAERVIGSIRRECLDHMMVLSEVHLRRILTSYFQYYHESRPHQSLDRNAPDPRQIEPPGDGGIVSISQVGGLHHRYCRPRRAA